MRKGDIFLTIGVLMLMLDINLMILYEPTKVMAVIVFNSFLLGVFLIILGIYKKGNERP